MGICSAAACVGSGEVDFGSIEVLDVGFVCSVACASLLEDASPEYDDLF